MRNGVRVQIAAVVPVVLAVLLTGLLTGCGASTEEGDRKARVGEILEGNSAMEGRPAGIRLPYLGYDFLVSTPKPSLGALLREREEDGGESVDPEAAEGTSFVGVDYHYQRVDDDARLVLGYDPRWVKYVPAPELSLVADGKEYPIGPIGSEARNPGPWTVVVRGTPREVRVRLSFEGRNFEADPGGVSDRVADVYEGRLPRLTRASCPDQREVPVGGGVSFVGTKCGVEHGGPVPYVAGLGWAPAGQAWVVVQAKIDINTFFAQGTGSDYISRDTEYGEPTYTLGGEPPARIEDEDGNEIGSRPSDMRVYDFRRVIFAVPQDQRRSKLVMSLTYRGIPKAGEPKSAAAATFDFRRTVDLVYR